MSKERVLLEVKPKVGLTCVYIKLSMEDGLLYAWETYTHRMPESYWLEGYQTTEPPVIRVQQSVHFALSKRYGDVKYLAVWIDGDVVMTEPVGETPTELDIINGFDLIQSIERIV